MSYEYSKKLNTKWDDMINYINEHGVINSNLALLCENIESTCTLRNNTDKFVECLNSAVTIIRALAGLGVAVHIIPPSSTFTDIHGKIIVMEEFDEGIIAVNLKKNANVYFTTCFIDNDNTVVYVLGY